MKLTIALVRLQSPEELQKPKVNTSSFFAEFYDNSNLSITTQAFVYQFRKQIPSIYQIDIETLPTFYSDLTLSVAILFVKRHGQSSFQETQFLSVLALVYFFVCFCLRLKINDNKTKRRFNDSMSSLSSSTYIERRPVLLSLIFIHVMFCKTLLLEFRFSSCVFFFNQSGANRKKKPASWLKRVFPRSAQFACFCFEF